MPRLVAGLKYTVPGTCYTHTTRNSIKPQLRPTIDCSYAFVAQSRERERISLYLEVGLDPQH